MNYMLVLRRLLIAATCLSLFLSAGMIQGSELARLPAAKSEQPTSRRADRIKSRRRSKKNAVDTVSTSSAGESPATRFQMQRAGRRVVILDTQTGETKIIEPEAEAPYQNVEVGKAWVVVTVLGNVSERTPANQK